MRHLWKQYAGSWLRLESVMMLVFALAGWRSGLAPISDNSFLCHLRTGQWMLTHGIPRVDIFSFTAQGRPWIAESWLADLIYGFIHARFGDSGIMVFNAVSWAAIGAIWYRLALRLSGDRMNAFVIAGLSFGASWTVWSARPLMMGILAFLLLVWIVESGSRRYAPAAIPVVMWFWANVHGSFLLGFAYVGLYLISQWLAGNRPWKGRERTIALWSAAAFVLCFLNPYGAGLIAAPFHLLSRYEVLSKVTEWRPAAIGSVQARMYGLWIIALTISLAAGSRRRIATDLVIAVPFIALGFWAERNIAIAPMVTMPIAARALHDRRRYSFDSNLLLNGVLGGLMLIAGCIWTVRASAAPRMDFSTYPAGAMEYLEARSLLGKRLLSTDEWGDYILFKYWPRQLVFIDDRFDLYPPPVFLDMYRLLNGSRAWHDVLEKYQIDLVVWPRTRSATEALDREPGWEGIFKDRSTVVYLRTESVRDITGNQTRGRR